MLLLALALLGTGAFAAVGGYLRYRQVDAALREGRPIGSGSAAHLVSLAVLLCLILAAVYVDHAGGLSMPASAVVCVDVGSTFTKAALVDGDTGALLAHRQPPDHPRARDVLDGIDACRPRSPEHPAAADAEVLACSSAGGGLRIAVVGNEELVTAEAGRRVALSSGGKVVAVLGRASAEAAFLELAAERGPTWCC